MPEEFKQSKYEVIFVDGVDKQLTLQEFEAQVNAAGENGMPIIGANLSVAIDSHSGDTYYVYFALVETKSMVSHIVSQADLERPW